MLESKEVASTTSGGMFMSEKYLIVSELPQVPQYDPEQMAEGLGMTL